MRLVAKLVAMGAALVVALVAALYVLKGIAWFAAWCWDHWFLGPRVGFAVVFILLFVVGPGLASWLEDRRGAARSG